MHLRKTPQQRLVKVFLPVFEQTCVVGGFKIGSMILLPVV